MSNRIGSIGFGEWIITTPRFFGAHTKGLFSFALILS
jgi:hypothetical protein